jgi:GT2 family glycosyltransferase
MLNTGANAAPDGWLMLFNDDVLCYGAFAETVGGFDKNTLYGPNILKKPAFWVGKPIQYLYGWMIIVQKTAFLDVGGFDENYIAAGVDDIDFCWTAQNKGYRIKSVKLPFTHIADQPDFDHRRKKWDDKYEQNMEKNRQRFAEKVKNG